MLVTNVKFGNTSLPLETCCPLMQSPSWDPVLLVSGSSCLSGGSWLDLCLTAELVPV